jgi:integrase
LTLKEIREFHRQKRSDREAAEKEARDPRRTLGGYCEAEYLPRLRLNTKARTIASHVCIIRKWLTPLADKALNDVTPSDLDSLVMRPMLEDGRSPTYVEKALRTFSVIWNQAKSAGLTQGDNPVSKIKIPKKDEARDRFLSKEEAVKLLDRLKEQHPDVYDVAIMSLYSGMRVGECLKLIWADVNMEDGTIFVKDTKNTQNRHTYITSEMREVLTSRQTGQSKTDKVYPSTRGGDGYNNTWLQFKGAFDELGLNSGVTDSRQKVVIHTLRHTYESWLVQKGTPLYTVSQLLGHSSLTMTMRYAHLAPDSKRAAAMDLEGILNRK